MKIPNVKAIVVKGLTAGFLGAALLAAGPAKAEAQAFSVGVQFGGPHYGFAGPGFVARRDWEREEFARQQAFARHEEFVRHEQFVRHEERWPAYGFYGRR